MADYLFSVYLLAFLSTYHRKRRDATRARLGVAIHLSTTFRWGNLAKPDSHWQTTRQRSEFPSA